MQDVLFLNSLKRVHSPPKNEEKYMKLKLREIINKLAKEAVLHSEELLGSGCGQQKKEMAINYVTERLPFSGFGKKLVAILLSWLIDDAVEASVSYLNSLSNEKGEN